MKALLLKLVKCLMVVNLLVAAPLFVTPAAVFATENTDEIVGDDQYIPDDQGDMTDDSDTVYDDSMEDEGAEE